MSALFLCGVALALGQTAPPPDFLRDTLRTCTRLECSFRGPERRLDFVLSDRATLEKLAAVMVFDRQGVAVARFATEESLLLCRIWPAAGTGPAHEFGLVERRVVRYGPNAGYFAILQSTAFHDLIRKQAREKQGSAEAANTENTGKLTFVGAYQPSTRTAPSTGISLATNRDAKA
jgi:hypothetical protein